MTSIALASQLRDLENQQKQLMGFQNQLAAPKQVNQHTPLVNAIAAFFNARQLKQLSDQRKDVFKKHEQSSKDATQQLLFTLGLTDKPPKPKQELQGPQELGQQGNIDMNQMSIPLNPAEGIPGQAVDKRQLLAQALSNPNLDPAMKAMAMKSLFAQQSSGPLSNLGKTVQDLKGLGINPTSQQILDRFSGKNKGQNITINNIPKVKPGQVLRKDAAGNLRVENVEGANVQTREQAATSQTIQSGIKFTEGFINGATIKNPKTGEAFQIPGFLNSDGTVNKKMVAAAEFNVPFADGRTHRVRLKEMLQGKLRAETGAAAPEAEVSNLMERFLPKTLDNDVTIFDKLNRLKLFSSQFLSRTDPQLYRELRSRVLTDKPNMIPSLLRKLKLKNSGSVGSNIDSIIATEIKLRGGGELNNSQQNNNEIPEVKTQADFDKLPKGTIFIEDGKKFRKQ